MEAESELNGSLGRGCPFIGLQEVPKNKETKLLRDYLFVEINLNALLFFKRLSCSQEGSMVSSTKFVVLGLHESHE